MMQRAGKKYDERTKFRLWQPESHPIELSTHSIAHQKPDYVHYNPKEAGYVKIPEDWIYGSAVDYNGGKGILDIILLDPLII